MNEKASKNTVKHAGTILNPEEVLVVATAHSLIFGSQPIYKYEDSLWYPTDAEPADKDFIKVDQQTLVRACDAGQAKVIQKVEKVDDHSCVRVVDITFEDAGGTESFGNVIQNASEKVRSIARESGIKTNGKSSPFSCYEIIDLNAIERKR